MTGTEMSAISLIDELEVELNKRIAEHQEVLDELSEYSVDREYSEASIESIEVTLGWIKRWRKEHERK